MKNIPENPEIVVGGGRFALAEAHALALNNPDKNICVLFRHEKYVKAAQNEDLDHFFPESSIIEIPKNIHFLTNKDFSKLDPTALKYFFASYPAQKTRMIMEELVKENSKAFTDCLFLCGSKGIELKTRMLMHKVLGEIFPDARERIAILVGPNIAKDVFEKSHVVATIAGQEEVTSEFAELFEGSSIIRTHESTEIYGLDLAGVLKNVHSLAFGMAEGLKLSDSTRTSLMQRALAELKQLCKAFKCDTEEVLQGISGDYALAMMGSTRNAQAGKAFAEKGELPEDKLVEGIKSLPAVLRLGMEKNIRLPIIEMIAAVLLKKIPPEEAAELLTSNGRDATEKPNEKLIAGIEEFVTTS